MNSILCSSLSASFVLLLSVVAHADEPDKPVNPNASAIDAPVENTANTIFADALANHYAYVDVSRSLMAANGLGIDVASAEPALRAQLGLPENIGLVVTAAPDESNGAKA